MSSGGEASEHHTPCTNCRRAEPRPEVRFCPNCGAVLPGRSGAKPSRTGFAALARQLPPSEPQSPKLKEAPTDPLQKETQPWAINSLPAPIVSPIPAPEVDDVSGPFLTRSLRGDRGLGFAGEVAAVALGVGVLIATGESASHPKRPDWSPALVLVTGAALLALCLWQAGRLRRAYPQLARGWYAGRSAWATTLLSFLIGSGILGLILLVLGPLGLLAVCVGGILVFTLGPFAWLLLALIVFVIGRMVLHTIRRRHVL